MLMDKIRKLFAREEVPKDAKEVVRHADNLGDVLGGLDELITRNEMEVNSIHRELESLESAESAEIERIRSGTLPARTRNNVLRRIQRLRKQMDNLEERQRIYNRNITLQIHLVGRIQALGAMDLRGVGEERIDAILAEYEEELGDYQGMLELDGGTEVEVGSLLDDSRELAALEATIVGAAVGGDAPARESRAPVAQERVPRVRSAALAPAALAPAAPAPAAPELRAESNGHGEEALG